MTTNTSEIKEKILSVLRRNGPSLPVRIAKETGLSTLFASAFLSELFSEKKIKLSAMKIGSSPLYFLPGQESILERFYPHLKNKEKEAFMLLKEKSFLEDKTQEPAIRVALRAIKDFAIPFTKNENLYWRYLTIQESEFPEEKKSKQIFEEKESAQKEKKSEEKLNIFDEKPRKTEKKKTKKPAKKTQKKQDDKFFNKVKEHLSGKSIEILDIENFNKNDLTLRIRKNREEQLLIAYNKKRINENDIIKAHKKASELNLPYTIISLGEPLKRLNGLIEAVKNLSGIDKIE